jgi:TP901 family phage tail tape measure protein
MASNPFSDGIDVKVDAETSGFESALGGAMSQLGNFKYQIGLLGGAIATVSAGGIAKGVSAFNDFEDAMTESLAIMGDVSDEMEGNMEDTARSVAQETTFSANEAANSYYYLASAGMDAQESINSLPQVADFAQAGMFDMATATDLLTDSLTALGQDSEDPQEQMKNMQELSDQLVKANTMANASVEQFSEALTNRAAAAIRNYNVDQEEGIALLASFADQGVKGRKAGRRLSIMLRDMQNAAQDNAEKFEELGIQVFDSEGNMRDMTDIMSDMENALGDMSQEQRNAAINQLGFTQQAQAGINALLGQSDAIAEYKGGLEDAGGTTEEVASKQLTSFNKQMQLLKSQVNEIFISVGEQLRPALASIIEPITDGISAFQDFNEATDGMAATVALVIGLVTGLITAGAALVSALGGVAAIVGTVSAVLTGVVAPALAVAAVVAALWLAWKNNFLNIQGVTKRVLGFVKDLVETVLGEIQAFWQQHGEAIIRTVKQAFAFIAMVIETYVMFLWNNLYKPIFKSIEELWNAHGQQLIGETKKTFDFIAGIVQDVLNFVMPFVKTVLQTIHAFWDRYGESIMDIVTNVFDMIRVVIEGVLDTVISIVRIALALLRGDFSGALDILVGLVQRQFDRIVQLVELALDTLVNIVEISVDAVINAITSMLDSVVNTVSNFGSDVYDAGKSLIESFVDGIKSMASAPVDAVKGIAGSVTKHLPSSDAKRGPFSQLTDSGEGFSEAFAKGIKDSVGMVTGATSMVARRASIDGSDMVSDSVALTSAGNRARADALSTMDPAQMVDTFEAAMQRTDGSTDVVDKLDELMRRLEQLEFIAELNMDSKKMAEANATAKDRFTDAQVTSR